MSGKIMSGKIVAAAAAAILLGSTTLASAQALVIPSYGYPYGYYGYAPAYPPAITLGLGVAPTLGVGVAPGYYAPRVYNYAPGYVVPGYGWNVATWNTW